MAGSVPSREVLERIRVASIYLQPSHRAEVLASIAQADPNDGGRVVEAVRGTCATLSLAEQVKLLTAISQTSSENQERLLSGAEIAQKVAVREGRPTVIWLDNPVRSLVGGDRRGVGIWDLLVGLGTSTQISAAFSALSASNRPVVLPPIQLDVLSPGAAEERSGSSPGLQMFRLTDDGPLLPSPVRISPNESRKFLLVGDSYGGVTLAGLPFPWKDATAEVLVRGSQTGLRAGSRLGVDVSIRDPVISTGLAYLTRGSFPLARHFVDVAQGRLKPKGANPLAAAAAGYILVGCTRDEEAPWHQWIDNLARNFAWMPDGAILQARLLLQLRSRQEENMTLARRSLTQAFRRGLPYYSMGLQWLVESLELFEDEEMVAIRGAVRKVAWKADLQQPFLVLRLSP